MPVTARIDHVAVAVPSIADAAARWHQRLGGGWVGPIDRFDGTGFVFRQLRYGNGARLELLEPTDGDRFLTAFLTRFGTRIHHVTLKVPDLLEAVRVVERAGYDVVDVSRQDGDWHEAFLRPSQVGGLVVQLAWSPRDIEAWVRHRGGVVEEPASTAAALHGPTLTHPDPDAAARLWALLGAEVTADGACLVARWTGQPMDVRVEAGEVAAAVGLRFGRADEQWLEDPVVEEEGEGL